MRTLLLCFLIALTCLTANCFAQVNDCGTGYMHTFSDGQAAPLEYELGPPTNSQMSSTMGMQASVPMNCQAANSMPCGCAENVGPGVQKLRTLSDGRPFLKSLVDEQWSRSIGVYGGSENFRANGADVFDGQIDLNDDEVYGLEVGRRHSSYLRSTFDFTYRNSGLTDITGSSNGELEVFSLMKNLYVDLKPGCTLSPYCGLGFGWAYLDGQGSYLGNPARISGESAFACQTYGGLNLKLQKQLAFYTEYRYFSTDDVDLEGMGTLINQGNYSSHNVFFGLRYGY